MDNQEHLLDCALNLFSRRGYDAVSVREVVEAAGVTKPTLYHYFDSKRGLLEALLEREAARLMTGLRLAAVYEHDLVLTLTRIARVYFQFAELHPAFYGWQLSMTFAPPESEAYGAVQPFARQEWTILANVFKQAAEDHGNLRGRHDRYAVGFLGALNAVIGLHLTEGLRLSEVVLHQTIQYFLHGIFS